MYMISTVRGAYSVVKGEQELFILIVFSDAMEFSSRGDLREDGAYEADRTSK